MAEITVSRAPALAIGALSRRSGVHIETIRFYERIGILPKPPRTQGGHRVYGQGHLKRLSFVRRSRELGFTLDEVRGLLGLVDSGDYTCAEVKEITLHHLADVRRKIADLRRLERALAEIVAKCKGRKVPECPVIDALFDARTDTLNRAPSARGR